MAERNSTAAQRKTAILQMIACGVLWSTGGIFIKLIPWNAFAIAGVRSLIAALVVLIYIKKRSIPLRMTKPALISGLFMTGIFNCFVIANKLTTAANAIVLQFTSPVFMLILGAVFLRQKCRKGDMITVAVTLCGISLFFFDQLAPGNILGNCFGILAGLMVAATYLAVGEVDENTRMNGVLIGQLLTALIGTPFVFFTDCEFTPVTVSCILALGVVQLGIPYVLFALSIKHCSPLACNLIGVVEPLLNPVWVFLFDGEAPGIYALCGACVVIASIVSWCIWNEKEERRMEGNKGQLEESGIVMGRFQPFHLDHLRYVLEAKKHCRRLIVGITNFDPAEAKPENPFDRERAEKSANPFSYYERYAMIKSSLLEEGLDAVDFDIVPLPVETPDKIKSFVPQEGVCFLTIYDAWGERKAELLKEQGFPVRVLWRKTKEEKGISATEVRKKMAEGAPWAELVPRAVYSWITERQLEERVREARLTAGPEKIGD